MKKLAKFVLAIGVLVLGGAIALWYAGRGEVENRVDIELARLAGDGIEVSHGTRNISGFPKSYIVELTDVDVTFHNTPLRARLPRLTAEADALNPDRLVFRFPERFELLLDQPAPEDQPASDSEGEVDAAPDSAGPLRLEVETDALEIAVTGQPGTGQTVTTEAASVILIHAAEAQHYNLAVELGGIAASTRLPAGPTGGDITTNARIAFYDLAMVVTEPVQPMVTIESQASELIATLRSDLRGAEELAAIFSGTNQGQLDGSLQFGDAVTLWRVEGGGESIDGTLRISSKSGASTYEIDGNRARLSTSSQNNLIELLPVDPAAPIGGAIAFTTLDLLTDGPLGPSEELAPAAIKMNWIGVSPDDTLWSKLDAGGALARDPINLFVNLEGTMRLTKHPEELEPGEGPPFDFGNVSINEMLIEALGARIEAKGDLEFVPPMPLPHGQVRIDFRSAIEALRSLETAKLVDSGLVEYVVLLSQAFTRPGEAPGHLYSEIELGPQGILVNGIPAQ